jgi:hypothetical protein
MAKWIGEQYNGYSQLQVSLGCVDAAHDDGGVGDASGSSPSFSFRDRCLIALTRTGLLLLPIFKNCISW